jgi:plasmid stabilization system protein ParE
VNYSVTWLPDAESELAAIWMASTDRNGVTKASAEIDRLLAENGPNGGESRPSNTRVTFVRPLAVLFRVDTTTRTRCGRAGVGIPLRDGARARLHTNEPGVNPGSTAL